MTISRIHIVKGDEYKQLIYAEAMVPNELDADKEYYTVSEVEKAAHDFVESGGLANIDIEHNKQNIPASVVESFIVRWEGTEFAKDAWVVGIHIFEEEHFELVLAGLINGLSIEALVVKNPEVVVVDVPDSIVGETSVSFGHSHKYTVKYDVSGTFLGGATDEVEGHVHQITKGTATSFSDGHNHRLVGMGGLSICNA